MRDNPVSEFRLGLETELLQRFLLDLNFVFVCVQ